MKKLVAKGLAASLLALIILVIFEEDISASAYSSLMGLLSFAWITFSVWASVILWKQE